ncbi:hypothetical protein MCHIJ_36020 [Mycolicibacterium chitae]|uniref:Phosphonate C-P lyase system protein PhnG n=1 Tax=Mycolicibacterium chitae TaxID=1792 RepID=A0A448I6C0_MYCCI|nr:phosphonate C-P lyase system protein PhnG [Mycolicibacterium chitae]MCV7108200.1 phosphonate C-P lyase system protein PhnG [Mycolicibacterium chitae]BBZ04165.1 hypothetical protein MCHIJ_36020 [Mycolicibacterium chitae]VEG47815.1 phosphonate C-P lyase system protein PhnG [Mycolicibacterium chitae]
MSPEHRFEALAAAEAADLEALANDILAEVPGVEVIAGPESVSAPIRLPIPGTDSSTAVLGHVGLSRCTVELGGVRGDGYRSGYDPVGAVAAAVCDAAAQLGGPHAARVEHLCRQTAEQVQHATRERARRVAATRLAEA